MWGLCQLPIMCLSSLSPHLLSLSILPLPGPLVLPFVCHPHHFSLASLTSSPFSPFSHSLNSQSLFFPSISSSITVFPYFLFLCFSPSPLLSSILLHHHLHCFLLLLNLLPLFSLPLPDFPSPRLLPSILLHHHLHSRVFYGAPRSYLILVSSSLRTLTRSFIFHPRISSPYLPPRPYLLASTAFSPSLKA